MTFEANHITKSCLVNSSSLSFETRYESGSFFQSSIGISCIVTEKPKYNASFPVRIALANPAPKCSPSLGTSLSGIMLSLLVMRFSILSCASVHEEPRGATVLVAPITCKRITSGAPSTKFITPFFDAALQATSIPNRLLLLSYIRDVEELIYLGAFVSLTRILGRILAVKAMIRRCLSRIGIIMRPRKVSYISSLILFVLTSPNSRRRSLSSPFPLAHREKAFQLLLA